MILTLERPKENQLYYSWISTNYDMSILEEEKFMVEVLERSGLSRKSRERI